MPRSLKLYAGLLFRYLRPHWRRALVLGVLMLAGTGLGVAAPQFIRSFIDTALEDGELNRLYLAAALFLAFALAAQALQGLTVYIGRDLAWRATNRLRSDLLLHILRLDLSFYNARTPGELQQRVDGDVSQLNSLLSGFIVQLLIGILLALGISVALLLDDWRIGLPISIFCAVYVWLFVRGLALAVPRRRVEREASASLSGFLGERLSGVKDIQTSGAVGYVMSRFRAVMLAAVRADVLARMAWRVPNVSGLSLFYLVMAGAMALGTWLFQRDAITVGTIYLRLHYLKQLHHPMAAIAQRMGTAQSAGVSAQRVIELMDTKSTVPEGRGATVPAGELSIEFENVSFAYSPDTPVLRHVSFSLGPRRVLGLLGRTGSGKTTLSQLLFRLYDPQKGSVRLGDVDVRNVPSAELRRRISMVTQDVQLFQSSVRDNLTLFDPSIRDDRIQESILALGLEEWYRTLPDGLDTELKTGGGQLSAGEAQLLAFTRVFLKDPDVVVLDEASSRLDPSTEQLIDQAVENLLRDRTGVIVAHRLGTVARVDEIMIIEDGRVLEHGSRETLETDEASRFHELRRVGLEEVLA